MTVKKLIATLRKLPSTWEVKMWCPETEFYEPVTGYVSDPRLKEINLQTLDE